MDAGNRRACRGLSRRNADPFPGKKGTFCFFQEKQNVPFLAVPFLAPFFPILLFACKRHILPYTFCMPRTIRASAADICYHVLNRGNARGTVFHSDGDYAAFMHLMREAGRRVPMRILAYCLMPNHFHLVLWPSGDGDLSRWMQWLLTSHVRRYHHHYAGSGHVWQGRFKAFPIQSDEHLLTVMRYVERNPVRSPSIAVSSARMWPWSSAVTATPGIDRPPLDPGPVPRRRDWLAWVDSPLSAGDETAIRNCVSRGAPFGDASWTDRVAGRLGLEASLRPRGRPRSR